VRHWLIAEPEQVSQDEWHLIGDTLLGVWGEFKTWKTLARGKLKKSIVYLPTLQAPWW
jgi:hypothetical protein